MHGLCIVLDAMDMGLEFAVGCCHAMSHHAFLWVEDDPLNMKRHCAQSNIRWHFAKGKLQKSVVCALQEKQKRNALNRTPLVDVTPRQAQSGLALPHVTPLPLQSLRKALSSRASPASALSPRAASATALSPRAAPASALSSGTVPASGPGTGQDSAVTTPASIGQDSVEEQCLSAGRWLRGLAQECVDNMYTPAKPQCTEEDDAEAQVSANVQN